MQFNVSFIFPDEIPAAEIYSRIINANLVDNHFETSLYAVTNEVNLNVDLTEANTIEPYTDTIDFLSKLPAYNSHGNVIFDHLNDTVNYAESLKKSHHTHDRYLSIGRILNAINDWFSDHEINRLVSDDDLPNIRLWEDPHDTNTFRMIHLPWIGPFSIEAVTKSRVEYKVDCNNAEDFINTINSINPVEDRVVPSKKKLKDEGTSDAEVQKDDFSSLFKMMFTSTEVSKIEKAIEDFCENDLTISQFIRSAVNEKIASLKDEHCGDDETCGNCNKCKCHNDCDRWETENDQHDNKKVSSKSKEKPDIDWDAIAGDLFGSIFGDAFKLLNDLRNDKEDDKHE